MRLSRMQHAQRAFEEALLALEFSDIDEVKRNVIKKDLKDKIELSRHPSNEEQLKKKRGKSFDL